MLEDRGAQLPPSEAQFGMWFAHQLDPTRRLYYFADYADITGPLDVQLLDAALRQTVAEADTLNVRFVEGQGGELQQVVEPLSDWCVTELDTSTEPDPHAAAHAWMRAELSKRRDLSRDRLFDSAIIKIASDRYYWYWGVHHIAMDSFGMGLFVSRVCELYRARQQGESPPAPRFGRLRELIAEEAAAQSSDLYEHDRAYWVDQFADRPSLQALGSRPATGDGGRQGSFEMIRAIVPVPASVVDGLRNVAERVGGSWGRMAIAATGLYLCRMSDGRGTTLSLPSHRRLTPLARQTPCTMANVLPVRIKLSNTMTLSDYCAHAFSQIEGTLSHHRYRGERLRRELDRAHRGIGYFGPPVNVVRNDYRVDLGGVSAQIHNLFVPTLEDFNIGFEDRGARNQFSLHVRGSSASRTLGELNQHANDLLTLLAAVATADPQQSVERIGGWH